MHLNHPRTHNIANRTRRRLVVVVGLLCAALCLGLVHPSVARGAADDRPDLKPYRVHISIAFDQLPGFTPHFKQQTLSRIAALAERTYGEMWDVQIQLNERLSPASPTGLERLTIEDLQKKFSETDVDKAFFLVVGLQGVRHVVAGRVWDAETRTLGETERTAHAQRRMVADASFALIGRLFEPVLTIEKIEKQTIRLRLHAGEFPAVDPQAAQLKKGDLCVAFFRYLDKKKVVSKIQPVPWTYLMVEEIDRGKVTCRLISASRRPLGIRRRRRVEMIAVRVRPRHSGTRLRLLPRQNASKPLIGHSVEVIAKTLRTDEASGEPRKFITNRSGEVDISLDPAHPIVWIYVRSGKALLARTPYMPGVRRFEVAELPDDSLRLRVEGELALLKGEFVDTIARRAALLSRLNRLAEDDTSTGDDLQARAKALRAELNQLPDLTYFEQRINAIRVPAVRRANSYKGRLGKVKVRQIENLCNGTRTLVRKYLDPKKLRDQLREIIELSDAGT